MEEFISAVQLLAETCEFGDIREEMIRDRIAAGVLDRRLSEKLQLDVLIIKLQLVVSLQLLSLPGRPDDALYLQELLLCRLQELLLCRLPELLRRNLGDLLLG